MEAESATVFGSFTIVGTEKSVPSNTSVKGILGLWTFGRFFPSSTTLFIYALGFSLALSLFPIP